MNNLRIVDGVTYKEFPEQERPCLGCAFSKDLVENGGKGCSPFFSNYCRAARIIWFKVEPTQEATTDIPATSQDAHQVGGTHYLKTIQPWDIITAWKLGFHRGNILKYVLRAPEKNGKEDLEKAKHYLQYCIDNYDELKEIGML